ncbi:MAG: DUF58 domain-containing protein [Lentisphaeraceae bacterium]|nr:DUF58 domain-containing protein [Lentisphaeraceae bacterium]
MSKPENNKGIHVELKDLIKLQYKARGFHFLPKQPMSSLLSGRHASRLRGRGLDFEELRLYQAGDDIRTIDWKVTNRTRQAYVRVYGEEKERNVIFICDQRLSMFFGSQKALKSVSAAEALALGAWKVISSGDRVGGLIFNDSEIKEFKPQRSRKAVTALLHEAARMNQQLSLQNDIVENPGMLNKALDQVSRVRRHNSLIVIVSDFSGVTMDTHELVKSMSRNNDVVLVLVYDLLAKEFPNNKFPIRVSDGDKHLELDLSNQKLKNTVPDLLKGRLKGLTEALAKFGVPVLPVHTGRDIDLQLREILGHGDLQFFGDENPSMKGSR